MAKVILKKGINPLHQMLESVKVLKDIDLEVNQNNSLVLDLTDVEWIFPCSALLLSNKIDSLRRRNIKCSFLQSLNKGVENYLSTIGFPFGKDISKLSYMPINHLVSEAKGTPTFERQLNVITEIVKNHFPQDLMNGVMHIIGELADNIDQHSEFSHASIMAQMYGRGGFIDLGVYDDGLTIPGVFSKNGLTFDNDCHSIELALKGVSTKKEAGRGTGLPSIKEIVHKGLSGQFHVLSRRGLFTLNGCKEYKQLLDVPLDGTLIYVRFNAPEKLNIYEYLP